MKKLPALALLLALLLPGFALAADQPFTLRTIEVEDIETGSMPKLTLECFDRNGDEMLGDSENATVEFFDRLGNSRGTVSMDCSGEETSTVLFGEEGIYYAVAGLDCAPGCCAAGLCENRDYFSVANPFSMANIPDGNALSAAVAVAVAFFVVKKKK